MSKNVIQVNGTTVFVCEPVGKTLGSERDAVDLIGEARAHGAGLVAVPVARLDDDFFRLGTRVLGEFIQKFVTYQVRLAIVGDIGRHVEASTALRDFVYETNRGTQIWFVAGLDDLREKLS
jgi:hypothetical protein